MAKIETDRDILTLINVFTVAPEKQEALVALLIEATKQTMRHLPGFISANIHKSYDGSVSSTTRNGEAVMILMQC
jgi:antibiotic biosynthesis monooxygenase (ABM) superfamily enzyme